MFLKYMAYYINDSDCFSKKLISLKYNEDLRFRLYVSITLVLASGLSLGDSCRCLPYRFHTWGIKQTWRSGTGFLLRSLMQKVVSK